MFQSGINPGKNPPPGPYYPRGLVCMPRGLHNCLWGASCAAAALLQAVVWDGRWRSRMSWQDPHGPGPPDGSIEILLRSAAAFTSISSLEKALHALHCLCLEWEGSRRGCFRRDTPQERVMALAIPDPSPPASPRCQPRFPLPKPPGACVPGMGAPWKGAGVQPCPSGTTPVPKVGGGEGVGQHPAPSPPP